MRQVEAEHMSASAIGFEDAAKYSQRRGLSAAVCADQTEYFARAKGEFQVLDRNPMTVVSGYVPNRDKSFASHGRGRDVV
jgi:hypothetical protein